MYLNAGHILNALTQIIWNNCDTDEFHIETIKDIISVELDQVGHKFANKYEFVNYIDFGGLVLHMQGVISREIAIANEDDTDIKDFLTMEDIDIRAWKI